MSYEEQLKQHLTNKLITQHEHDLALDLLNIGEYSFRDKWLIIKVPKQNADLWIRLKK